MTIVYTRIRTYDLFLQIESVASCYYAIQVLVGHKHGVISWIQTNRLHSAKARQYSSNKMFKQLFSGSIDEWTRSIPILESSKHASIKARLSEIIDNEPIV